MNFAGKIVLVTGASRGLGREIAVQFSRAGAIVAVHYNQNKHAADETISLLADVITDSPLRHTTFQCDIADEAAVPRLVQDVCRTFGRIDILVNNAGIYGGQKIDVVDYRSWLASWKSVADVNLFGVANLTYCVVECMKAKGEGGRIVNVSSRGVFRGEPDAPAYGASKAGLNSFAQSMAKALAPHNIFVATVAPGFIDTEMAKDVMSGPEGPSIAAQSPLNRIAKVEEVAHGVLFLASEKAAFMTGAILDINGASYLRS